MKKIEIRYKDDDNDLSFSMDKQNYSRKKLIEELKKYEEKLIE